MSDIKVNYPKKILICTLRDGTPIYETVENEEEYDTLCEEINDCKEYVRNYFKQYKP